MMPMFRPSATRPFAQERCSSSTRFGIAAAEADQNGCSTIAERNAAPSSHAGSSRSAIAPKHAAPARSDTTMTFLRSNRSPSAPPSGAKIPAMPNVSNNVSESHVAESVRS
jgi:hypothetical protein